MEAEELVAVLVDAAKTIGESGVVNDFSRHDFYLYASHVASLTPGEREDRESFAKLETTAPEARISVAWPYGGKELESTLRQRPFEIIGLLMRRVLNGDAAFFEALAEATREAVKNGKISKNKQLNRAGKVAAPPLVLSGVLGDPEWFGRIPIPTRKSKVPFAIWEACSGHEKNGTIPTRRDIRNHLKANALACPNLRTALKRLGLEWLKEGPRSSQV